MNTNERVKILRKVLGLSQESFGNMLGVKKSAISKIEKGENGLTIQLAKLICRIFNVNYFWLMEGIGEMFTAIPETILDELVDEYKLDKYDKFIIQTYLESSKEQQKVIKDFLLTLAEKVSKESSE